MYNNNNEIIIDKSKINENSQIQNTIDSKQKKNDFTKNEHFTNYKNSNGHSFKQNGHSNGHKTFEQNEHNSFSKETSHNGHTHDSRLTHSFSQNHEISHKGENHEDGKGENHRNYPVLENKSHLLNEETTVEIQFQGCRKELFYCPPNLKLQVGNEVIVETENGCDFGKVLGIGKLTYKKWVNYNQENKSSIYSILFKAGQKETLRQKSNLEEQQKIFEKVKSIIAQHKLEMRVTEVEWQFDRHRLTIYFLAPQRIDFRELVKELAKEYRTRIELRQITHRERARRISLWEGVCGRGICCSSFLHQIQPITIEHSKVQQLSANVTKLSGYCGRLKCCLAYEYDFYNNENARFPKLGSILDLGAASYKLIKFDIFKDNLTFFSDDIKSYRNFSLAEINEYAKQNKILEPKDTNCQLCDGLASPEEMQELLRLQDD